MTRTFSEKIQSLPQVACLGQQNGAASQDVGIFLKQAFRELIADALIRQDDKIITALKDIA